jgi:glycosyltransferase involved in cell wall biosynthesis
LHINYAVIVQQEWIRSIFLDKFSAKNVIVARPLPDNAEFQFTNFQKKYPDKLTLEKKIFFYPALPRVFKNFEVLIEAANILSKDLNLHFEIRFTFSAQESRYAKYLAKKIQNCSSIKLLGRLDQCQMVEQYLDCDFLVFPSKLETWGLPISEAKIYNKPILIGNAQYAREAIGDYDLVSFLDVNDPELWSRAMRGVMLGSWLYSRASLKPPFEPYARNWKALWPLLTDGI